MCTDMYNKSPFAIRVRNAIKILLEQYFFLSHELSYIQNPEL